MDQKNNNKYYHKLGVVWSTSVGRGFLVNMGGIPYPMSFDGIIYIVALKSHMLWFW